jgi:hypothetical protein
MHWSKERRIQNKDIQCIGQQNVLYRIRTDNTLVKRTSYIEEGHTMHWTKERRL